MNKVRQLKGAETPGSAYQSCQCHVSLNSQASQPRVHWLQKAKLMFTALKYVHDVLEADLILNAMSESGIMMAECKDKFGIALSTFMTMKVGIT